MILLRPRQGRFANRWMGCVVLLAALGWSPLLRADASPAGDELRLAIILTRHGVRSPLLSNEAMASFAAQPWPKWEVDPGIQTPRGNLLVALMGDYYRARFSKAGLLTGDPATDSPSVFVRADNDQRTIETGRILAKSLVPLGAPEVHSLAEGTIDPLFRPFKAHVGRPDSELAAAAVLGRMGGDPSNAERAYAAQFAELKGILYGPGVPVPPGSPFNAPSEVSSRDPRYLVTISGPLLAGLLCSESLILEYADGMPASDLGWGRMDGRAVADLLALHELYFDLAARTRYPAQVEGSNLASHILDTLEQAAVGDPVPGALGPSGEKLVVVVGHDTNIDNMGGVFGLNWWISGTQMDPVLPGGALVFELWKRGGQENAFYVRISYVAQTLGQMREASPLSLDNPPARSPIFVPGSSGKGPDFDSPLPAFVRQARRVIDPGFVAEEP
jgi:4-phytase / acid phosphatase